MTTHTICDACECVSHCSKNGCVPLVVEEPFFRDSPCSGSGAVSQFDAAVAAELPLVSTVAYNSHEICKWFAENVRVRLAAIAAAGEAA